MFVKVSGKPTVNFLPQVVARQIRS